MAYGSLLLVGRRGGYAGLASPTPLARNGASRCRPRSELAVEDPRLGFRPAGQPVEDERPGGRHPGGFAGLHAQPVRPELCGPAFSDPSAVGRPAVDARVNRARVEDHWLAPCGDFRAGHPNRGWRQRQFFTPRRPRPPGLAVVERVGACGAVATGPRCRSTYRSGFLGHRPLVDDWAGCAGWAGSPHAAPNGELPGGVGCRHGP